MNNFSKFGTKYGVLYFISYFKLDENSVIITVYFIVNLKYIYIYMYVADIIVIANIF